MKYVRRLSVPGLSNCRDLGGFACDGGVTRFGIFLRSEAPCGLSAGAVEQLKAYGLAESFDLRGEDEALWRPSSLEKALPYRRLSLSGGAETFDKKNLPQGEFSWDKVYIKRALEHRSWFRDAFTACAEADGMVLYHCTAGKDRTGILTCCLLAAVGVSREDIAADYCLSEVCLQDLFAAMKDGSLTIRERPSRFEPYVFHTPYEAMVKFYDFLTKTYGSVRSYLLDIGVTEQTIERLRKKFIDTN